MMTPLFCGGEAFDTGETIEGVDELVEDCDPAGPALFIEARWALFALFVGIDTFCGWVPLAKCSGMLGLGGSSDKAEDMDPRTRCVTFSNGLGRRFFVELWLSPFNFSRLVRTSPGAVVCEKLPDFKLFRMDFLTLPVLFSGGGVGEGEGSVVGPWCDEGLIGWIGYFESWSNRRRSMTDSERDGALEEGRGGYWLCGVSEGTGDGVGGG
jgi:hypothetical protein